MKWKMKEQQEIFSHCTEQKVIILVNIFNDI